MEIDEAVKADSLTMGNTKRCTQSTFNALLYNVKEEVQFASLQEMLSRSLTAGAIRKKKVSVLRNTVQFLMPGCVVMSINNFCYYYYPTTQLCPELKSHDTMKVRSPFWYVQTSGKPVLIEEASRMPP